MPVARDWAVARLVSGASITPQVLSNLAKTRIVVVGDGTVHLDEDGHEHSIHGTVTAEKYGAKFTSDEGDHFILVGPGNEDSVLPYLTKIVFD